MLQSLQHAVDDEIWSGDRPIIGTHSVGFRFYICCFKCNIAHFLTSFTNQVTDEWNVRVKTAKRKGLQHTLDNLNYCTLTEAISLLLFVDKNGGTKSGRFGAGPF